MSLFSRLTEKSWLTPGAEGFEDPADYRPAAMAVGLYVYFAIAAVIFSLIVAAYLMRMGIHEAMGHASGDWRPMPEPALLWVNTAILVLSSVAWEVARKAALPSSLRRQGPRFSSARLEKGSGVPAFAATTTAADSPRKLRLGTTLGGLLGIAFLGGQLLLWRHYYAGGYYLSANPANAFFYFLTAVHGLHLAGGLVAWLRVLNRPTLSGIRLCALYWHFLLLIWVLLVGLLLST